MMGTMTGYRARGSEGERPRSDSLLSPNERNAMAQVALMQERKRREAQERAELRRLRDQDTENGDDAA
jgi:hypothetical protein